MYPCQRLAVLVVTHDYISILSQVSVRIPQLLYPVLVETLLGIASFVLEIRYCLDDSFEDEVSRIVAKSISCIRRIERDSSAG